MNISIELYYFNFYFSGLIAVMTLFLLVGENLNIKETIYLSLVWPITFLLLLFYFTFYYPFLLISKVLK